MRQWAWVVATLYVVMLAVLTVPAILLAFMPEVRLAAAVQTYSAWGYWAWLVVMFIAQLALLSVPVRVASRRPVSRRSLWPAILAAGLMMGLLVAGAGYSLYELSLRNGNARWAAWVSWLPLGIGLLTWAIWAGIFARMGRPENAGRIVSQQSRWLFGGSILELLIAVPAHIVVRQRHDCCAGIMTFLGLATGAAVILFSFGPAVFFLFANRCQRLQPRSNGNSGATPQRDI
jgi:hypothetical protein